MWPVQPPFSVGKDDLISPMAQLIFVTHPSVKIDPHKSIDQWIVSEEGWRKVKRLIKKSFWKDVNRIYSSQENKAKRVAEEIADSFENLHLNTPLTLLGEVNRSSTGYMDRNDYEQAVEEFYLYPDKSYKDWEKANDATKRIVSAASEIMDENKNKTVAIVGHGMTGTLLLCFIKGIKPTRKEGPKNMGCFVKIDWDNKKLLTPWLKY